MKHVLMYNDTPVAVYDNEMKALEVAHRAEKELNKTTDHRFIHCYVRSVLENPTGIPTL
jgi:hypothetical protein